MFLLVSLCELCIDSDFKYEGTSPSPRFGINKLTKHRNIIDTQDDGVTITFSEYPVNTAILTQYSNLGIIFGGDSPYIETDISNPTSPVLSGTPQFRGTIEGKFVDPSDGVTPIVVESFKLDAGYFDENGSTRIEWFDPDGIKLGQRTNSQFGIETFEIKGGNIASWRTFNHVD